VAEAIAAEGPYDLIVDYLWGAPAEAVFATLTRADRRAGDAPERIRYIQVGIGAGEVAELPAMTLRGAPVQLFGSGIGGQAALGDAAAYDDLLARSPPARSASTSTRAARQGRAGLASGGKRPAHRLRALTAGRLDAGMVDVIRDGGEAIGVAGDCTEQRLATAAPHSCP
jgi:hypothetical protein